MGSDLADDRLRTFAQQLEVGIDLLERTPAIQAKQPDGLIKSGTNADTAGGHLSPVANNRVGLLIQFGVDGSNAQRYFSTIGTTVIALGGRVDRTLGSVVKAFLLLPGLNCQVATDIDNRCTAATTEYRLNAVVGQGHINCRGQAELAVGCRLGPTLFLRLRLDAKKTLEAIAQVIGNGFGYLFAGFFLELVEIAGFGGAGRYGNGCDLFVDHIGGVDIKITRTGEIGAEFRIGIAVEQRYPNSGSAGCPFATGLEADAVLQLLLSQGQHADIAPNAQIDAIGYHGTGADIAHRHTEAKPHGLQRTAAAIHTVFRSGGN